jgi:hypothetical protein
MGDVAQEMESLPNKLVVLSSILSSTTTTNKIVLP